MLGFNYWESLREISSKLVRLGIKSLATLEAWMEKMNLNAADIYDAKCRWALLENCKSESLT